MKFLKVMAFTTPSAQLEMIVIVFQDDVVG